MSVTKFKKGEDPYTLVVVSNSGEYHVLKNVLSHDDVTSMEYFPTLAILTKGHRYPMVFNWNEIKFYFEPTEDELETLESEIAAALTGWDEDVDDETSH